MTARGWMLIGFVCFIGFCFAAVTLAVRVFSLPLVLDCNVGAAMAVAISIEAVRQNPVATALWGLIVAAALLIGSLPLFIGLAIVMPILGHSTWHLYRKAIVRDTAQEHPTEWPYEGPGKSERGRVSQQSSLFSWHAG